MEIFEFFITIVNSIVGVLNGLLSFVERIFTPVIDLVQRWNNLFGRVAQ
ncbi:MAG TPA: hypothetical protein VF575_02510 [Candidatus Saccharimonadales bacterium]